VVKNANPDIFRPIDVPDVLKPYVRRALVADINEPVDMRIDVRATGYHYLGWIWRGRWQGLLNGETRFDSDVDGPLVVTGQIGTANVNAMMQRDVGQIFLEFSALGHFQLLGITGAQLFTNSKAPHVLNPKLAPYLANIQCAKDRPASAQIAMIAEVLSQLPRHTVSDGIRAAIDRMEAEHGDIRIAELVTALNLRERQFRADFTSLVGLTPKAFCKAIQVNRAFNQLLLSNGGDLADVAAKSGFSDQAHFTRAFSKFLGEAPKTYLKNVEATLERFVGQSRP